MQSRNNVFDTTSAQFRAFANSFILCRVGDDYIPICKSLAGQARRQFVIRDSWQGIAPHIDNLAVFHQNVPVMNVESMPLKLTQLRA